MQRDTTSITAVWFDDSLGWIPVRDGMLTFENFYEPTENATFHSSHQPLAYAKHSGIIYLRNGVGSIYVYYLELPPPYDMCGITLKPVSEVENLTFLVDGKSMPLKKVNYIDSKTMKITYHEPIDVMGLEHTIRIAGYVSSFTVILNQFNYWHEYILTKDYRRFLLDDPEKVGKYGSI